MKIKNILTSVIAGASLLAFVGAASATTYSGGGAAPAMPTSDINIYGASAQFTFWKTEGPLYLQAAGCSLGTSGMSADSKHFIQQATCGTNTLNFRVSSKASYDGPLAVDSNTTHPSRDTVCSSVGANYRPMLTLSDCSGGTCSNPSTTDTSDCYPVTIGASDVQVGDFKQESHGLLKGPQGGAQTDRNFKSNPFVLSASTTNYCSPQAIPFSFFAHDDIVTAASTTITNITTSEAKMIFQGLIKNWSDLQAQSMNSKALSICLRHAGSGTHATMDAFMGTVKLPTIAVPAGTSRIYFNDGSSDLLKCVDGVGTWTGSGAIGYADSDTGISGSHTGRLTIDGVAPTTTNVDDWSHAFTAIQRLYVSTTNAANPVYQDLCTYAGRPTTIAAVNPNWSATCNMKRIKDSLFGNFKVNTTNNTTYPFSGYHNNNCD
jgi:hypothetical protein